jgi:hypothetical protein
VNSAQTPRNGKGPGGRPDPKSNDAERLAEETARRNRSNRRLAAMVDGWQSVLDWLCPEKEDANGC